MNDDAKFFFFMCGFIGFVAFYISSSLIYGDLIHCLFHASIGCVFFSISGRLLLGFALSSNSAINKDTDLDKSSTGNLPRISKQDISGEELAASTNVEALRNSKGVSLPKPK